MTEILNEQICGSIKSSTGNIHINGEVRLSREGKVVAIIGGTISVVSKDETEQTYIGTFAVSYGNATDEKRSVSVNVNDGDYFSTASAAVMNTIGEIEAKYA